MTIKLFNGDSHTTVFGDTCNLKFTKVQCIEVQNFANASTDILFWAKTSPSIIYVKIIIRMISISNK